MSSKALLWAIKFQADDADIFDAFDRLLKKKTPARLSIRSDDDKVSERVLLKSYSKEKANIRAFITSRFLCWNTSRQALKPPPCRMWRGKGMHRFLPRQVTIGDGTGGTMMPYDLYKAAADQSKYDGEVNAGAPQYEVLDSETGKRWDNPMVIPDGAMVSLYTYQDRVQEKMT